MTDQNRGERWVTATVLEAVEQGEKEAPFLAVQLQVMESHEVIDTTVANFSKYMWPGYEEGKEVTCLLKERRGGNGWFIAATKGFSNPNPRSGGGQSSAPAQASAREAHHRQESKESAGGRHGNGPETTKVSVMNVSTDDKLIRSIALLATAIFAEGGWVKNLNQAITDAQNVAFGRESNLTGFLETKETK